MWCCGHGRERMATCPSAREVGGGRALYSEVEKKKKYIQVFYSE